MVPLWKPLGLTLSLLFSVAICSAQKLDASKAAQSKYDAMKAQILKGNLDVDWRELRLDAMVAGVDGSFDWRKANSEGVAAFNAGDYKKALQKGQEICGHNIASGDGHFLSMVSLKHLGNEATSNEEKAIVDKIMQSIIGSGDGKTEATAWFTISTSEEYFVLRLFGLKPKSQALVHEGSHYFDKMTVTSTDGKEIVLWFNTDSDMNAIAGALGGK
jgi:hypothetical protein